VEATKTTQEKPEETLKETTGTKKAVPDEEKPEGKKEDALETIPEEEDENKKKTKKSTKKRKASTPKEKKVTEKVIQTRSRTLKRDIAAVESDSSRAKARDIIEPLVRRAQVAAVTAQTVTSTGVGNADDLSAEDNQLLTMVFKMFDTDNDGVIDIDELEAVLRNLGFRPSVLEVSSIMKEASAGDSTVIPLRGFLNMMARIESEEKEQEQQEQQKQKEEDKKRRAKARSKKNTKSRTK